MQGEWDTDGMVNALHLVKTDGLVKTARRSSTNPLPPAWLRGFGFPVASGGASFGRGWIPLKTIRTMRNIPGTLTGPGFQGRGRGSHYLLNILEVIAILWIRNLTGQEGTSPGGVLAEMEAPKSTV